MKDKQENFIFPVLLSNEDGVFYARFPNDIIGESYGESVQSAIEAAREVVGLYIADYEDMRKEVLVPEVEPQDIREGERVVYVDIWMPFQRSRMKTAYKKKTLTIPTWLDILATKKNINFSQVLVEGLKEELGIL